MRRNTAQLPIAFTPPKLTLRIARTVLHTIVVTIWAGRLSG